MQIKKEHLDIPFSELIKGVTSTETPREFIRSSEKEFGMQWVELESMSEEELNGYIEHLDYLWNK